MILFYCLSALMFFDCVVLVMLVLVQLPKKEAGAGMAFGGGATDALFGAGSGNVLTKITKYAAGIFFGLALLMAVVAAHRNKGGADAMMEQLMKKGTPTSATPVASPTPLPTANSGLLQSTLLTNLPAAKPIAPGTNH